jgi:mannose-6-phosphate isomerase-like protein (cupin superfamily)
MDEKTNYSIHLDQKFGPLQLIDIDSFASSVTEDWYNQTLCQVNDCVIRLGVFKKGEFHWHKHEKEDEFFFVLKGRFRIDLEEQMIELGPQQGFMVPKGVMHKTSVEEPTVILMTEAASVKPTGD